MTRPSTTKYQRMLLTVLLDTVPMIALIIVSQALRKRISFAAKSALSAVRALGHPRDMRLDREYYKRGQSGAPSAIQEDRIIIAREIREREVFRGKAGAKASGRSLELARLCHLDRQISG